MSPKLICSGLLCGVLLVGCGGSSHSSATAVTHSETQQASIAVSTTTAPAHSATLSTTSSSATTRATTRATTHTTTHTPVAPPPASGPRVPATFTVAADGSLSPPTISVPAGYTVQVTFIDNAGGQIHAIVHTPKPLNIVAPPGGDAYLLVSHLPKGTYAIDINGKVSGSLVIGSAPGP